MTNIQPLVIHGSSGTFEAAVGRASRAISFPSNLNQLAPFVGVVDPDTLEQIQLDKVLIRRITLRSKHDNASRVILNNIWKSLCRSPLCLGPGTLHHLNKERSHFLENEPLQTSCRWASTPEVLRYFLWDLERSCSDLFSPAVWEALQKQSYSEANRGKYNSTR